MKLVYLLLIQIYFVFVQSQSDDNCFPQGVKVSLGDKYNPRSSKQQNFTYEITYFTNSSCNQSYVIIENSHSQTIEEQRNQIVTDLSTTPLTEHGINYTLQGYMHDFRIQGNSLGDNEYYQYFIVYQNQNDHEFHKKGPYRFYHHGGLDKKQFKLFWVADFDAPPVSQPALDSVYQKLQNNQEKYVAVIGGGDYAYDMQDQLGQKGLQFMKKTEEYFSSIPFNTIAGNHELKPYYDLFYRNPDYDNTKNNFYSWQLGSILFLGYYADGYLYKYLTQEQIQTWFTTTLDSLKGTYTWLIVYAHQPIYCSDPTTRQCFDPNYLNTIKLDFIEDIIKEYKVDIYMSGHVHKYERIHPTYKNQTYFNQTSECNLEKCNVYIEPQAPVYVIDGTTNTTHFGPNGTAYPKGPFTALVDAHQGYGELTYINETHLLYEHFGIDNQNNDKDILIDYFYIIKNQNAYLIQESSTSILIWCLAILFLALIFAGGYMYQYYRGKSLEYQYEHQYTAQI